MQRRIRRMLLVAASTTAVALLALPAALADPNDFVGPIFGISASGDDLLVADAGQGIVELSGGTASLVAPLPGASDVAPRAGGGLWALQSAGPGAQMLYRVDGSTATPFADLGAYEAKKDPYPVKQRPSPETIDSNPFDVADLGGGEALVADAAGNDLLLVDKHGKVKVVAVLPDQLVSTANIKAIAGCPTPSPELAFACGLPPMMPAEPVATSVAVGPDGAYYVGELKGFPAPTGFSRVWRIAPNARNAKCGQSPLCRVVVNGRTSIIDLAFGPDGKLNVVQVDDASWAALELDPTKAVGGSVHACVVATGACTTVASAVPILTSIAFDGSGDLWGSVLALVPGAADVVQLTP